MTAIPKCRIDYYYNYDFLDKFRKEFVCGFDAAVEDGESFFDNLEFTELDEIHLNQLEEMHDFLVKSFNEWMEMARNELITSLIESMSNKEFRENRRKVLEANEKLPIPERKHYFNTGRFSRDLTQSFTGPDSECYDTSDDEEDEEE